MLPYSDDHSDARPHGNPDGKPADYSDIALNDYAGDPDADALDEGTLVTLLRCAKCGRQESVDLKMTEAPPGSGSYLCEKCLSAYQHTGGDLIQANPASQANHVSSGTGAIPQLNSSLLARSRPAAPAGSQYATLNVPLDASQEEIKTAYTTARDFWQGQRDGPSKSIVPSELQALATAYAILRDPEKKEKYDKQLHKEIEEKRRSLTPLLQWRGHRVGDIAEFVLACEASTTDWGEGQSHFKNNSLLNWMIRGLHAPPQQQQIVDEIMKRPGATANDISLTHALNEALYRLEPTRPFRCFADPDRFQTIGSCTSLSSVEEFVKWADDHWALAVAHLYRGELVTWLDVQLRNSYIVAVGQDGLPAHRLYENATELYHKVVFPFKGTAREGVGLENLLEHLEPTLTRPALTIAFDGDASGYALDTWDGELPHKPIPVTIKNTTRGYVAGELTLAQIDQRTLVKQRLPQAWVDFDRLPTPPYPETLPTTVYSSSRVSGIPPKSASFTFQGADTATFSLYLGAFNALPRRPWRGPWKQRNITLSQYLTSPQYPTEVNTYPLRMRLMGFLGGYRLALWLRGLRGSLPGALLDGAVAYVLGWLFIALALLFAPHGQWGFFSVSQDFTGSVNFWVVCDGVLTLLLRPFSLVIYIFGYSLPPLLGVVFALRGFFVGRGKEFNHFKALADAEAHRGFGVFMMWLLWIVGGVVLTLNLGAHLEPLINLPWLAGTISFPFVAYYLQDPSIAPPLLFGVLALAPVLAAFATGFVPYIVARLLAALRSRLYAYTLQRNGALLTPQGKG